MSFTTTLDVLHGFVFEHTPSLLREFVKSPPVTKSLTEETSVALAEKRTVT
jgi:hypothetical protein